MDEIQETCQTEFQLKNPGVAVRNHGSIDTTAPTSVFQLI